MALNKYMHPRNLYRTKKANFQHLAIKYPEFRKHVFPDVSGKLFLDFKNPDSLRQLSITLLKDDFGLDVELAPDRLVPTVPLRLNYILWIEDILKGSGPMGDVYGIDIGTGGSCVYPLLSCRLHNWKFLATEVDDLNFSYAVKNIQKNNMDGLINVKKVNETAILQDVLKDSPETYAFSMCNPPFFSDHLEAQGITSSRSDDRPEPHSVNTASFTESIAFGGEVEFVKRMIHESVELKDKVRVFTSMVGKKTSLPPLKEELRKLKITNFSTTEFCQGKTMRWGIGWSFDDTVKFPKSEFKEKKKEKRAPLTYLVPEDVPDLMYTIEGVAYRIKEYFKELKIKCEDKKANDTKISLTITAYENTWSNQRRKRRQLKNEKLQDKNKEDVNKNNCLPEGSNVEISQKSKDAFGECKTLQNSNQSESTFSSSQTNVGISKKRKHSDDTEQQNQAKVSKIAEETDAGNQSVKIEAKEKSLNSSCDEVNIDEKSVASQLSKLSETGEECKNKNAHSETLAPDKEGEGNSGESRDNYLLKCDINIKQIEEEQVLIEMSWKDGTVREAMNQILQYLKNKLKSSS